MWGLPSTVSVGSESPHRYRCRRDYSWMATVGPRSSSWRSRLWNVSWSLVVQNTVDYLFFARISSHPQINVIFTNFTFKGTLYLTDGMLLMDTTWSGGEENLLWRCGMTCVPVDPGQKAGLVAVQPMDLDQSETLWGLLDSSSLTCDSARTLQHFDVTFIVFQNICAASPAIAALCFLILT